MTRIAPHLLPLRLLLDLHGDKALFLAGLAAALPLAGWLGSAIG